MWDYLAESINRCLVDGSNDLIVPPINGFTLQQHLPNAQLIVYPDSSHAPFYQYPELFLAHAALFLELTRSNRSGRSGAFVERPTGLAPLPDRRTLS